MKITNIECTLASYELAVLLSGGECEGVPCEGVVVEDASNSPTNPEGERTHDELANNTEWTCSLTCTLSVQTFSLFGKQFSSLLQYQQQTLHGWS